MSHAMGRHPCAGSDEQMVHGRARRQYRWLHRAGAAAAVKRRTRRRERRAGRAEVNPAGR